MNIHIAPNLNACLVLTTASVGAPIVHSSFMCLFALRARSTQSLRADAHKPPWLHASFFKQPHLARLEIGRASCREIVSRSVVGVEPSREAVGRCGDT